MNRLKFLEKARNIHGYKYKYPSIPEKITLKEKIEIEFEGILYSQTVSKHLLGKCPEKQILKRTNDDFISESKKIWGDRYDYSLVEYEGSLSNVDIIVDGFIYNQRSSSHLLGIKPDFRKNIQHYNLEEQDYIGTKEISEFLKKYKIDYLQDFVIGKFKFQFYLENNRTIIEYHGQLHQLENISMWDSMKNEYCEENFINLIIVKHDQINIVWEILWNNLREYIK